MNKRSKLLLTALVAAITTVAGVIICSIGTEAWYEYKQQQAWRRNFMRKHKSEDDYEPHGFFERAYTDLTNVSEKAESKIDQAVNRVLNDDDYLVAKQPETHGE